MLTRSADPPGHSLRLTGPYRAEDVPPINLANSSRLDALLRAGNLYLSLQDAIALALENNLDIEIQRYGPQLADASICGLRRVDSRAGFSTSVQQRPIQRSGSQGANVTGINTNASQPRLHATHPAVGNTVITQTGSAIPNLDPTLTGFLRWGHSTTPQTSAFVTGTNSYIQRHDPRTSALQQGFLTGTIVSLGPEQQQHHHQQPQRRFQSLHHVHAGPDFYAAPAAGFRCWR